VLRALVAGPAELREPLRHRLPPAPAVRPTNVS
jgi:hypothetical protein